MSDASIMSTRAPEPVGPYPHAKRAGNLLFLSGFGPRTPGPKSESLQKIPGVTLDENGAIVEYDIEAQCRSCFDNIVAVLEDSGSRLANVVDVQVFLTNIADDFQTMNKVFAEYFAGPPESGKPNPTRTTVEVTALPAPICVEAKVIATI
ncbi:MAG: RidA family protein [Planctomycetota bacterium]|nr:RidA family protein [Planctomycetota bacterium]